jgi:hypothetical protein
MPGRLSRRAGRSSRLEPVRNSRAGTEPGKVPRPVAAGFGVRGYAPLSGAGLLAAPAWKPSPVTSRAWNLEALLTGMARRKTPPARPHRKAPHSGALQSLRPTFGDQRSSLQALAEETSRGPGGRSKSQGASSRVSKTPPAMPKWLSERLKQPSRPESVATNVPGRQTFHPGKQTFHPGSQTFHPGSQTFHPGSQTFHPGSQTFHPGSQTFHPGRQTFLPGSLTFLPGRRTFHPGSLTFLPGRLTFQKRLR